MAADVGREFACRRGKLFAVNVVFPSEFGYQPPITKPMKNTMIVSRLFLLIALALSVVAAPKDPFKQIDDLLPTPDDARRASGAPGPGYWQQRAD